MGAMGGIIGLDYNILPILAKILNLTITPETLDNLQILERETISILNK